jgi:signal transduction histidine kinase
MTAPASIGPRTQASPARSSGRFDDDLVSVAAAGTDLRGGLREVAESLHRKHVVAGVEWWSPVADTAVCRRELSIGSHSAGLRIACGLGAAGTLMLIDARSTGIELAVERLRPMVHHWWTAERLADHAVRLARRNKALEDSTALIAHDVKSSLTSALRSGQLQEGLNQTFEIVDSIADTIQGEHAVARVASIEQAVGDAVRDLRGTTAEVAIGAGGQLPLPQDVLRVVLRNLLSNATAAGARSITISATAVGKRPALIVDDDGVGLHATTGYRTGSQRGLTLCRRLIGRFDGRIVLEPHPVKGTRAVVVLDGVRG